MFTRGLLSAHTFIGVAGITLLVWTAMPLKWDGVIETNTERGWLLVAGWALITGVIGGSVEGLAARTGHPGAAAVVLFVAGLVGSWMPFFALGRAAAIVAGQRRAGAVRG